LVFVFYCYLVLTIITTTTTTNSSCCQSRLHLVSPNSLSTSSPSKKKEDMHSIRSTTYYHAPTLLCCHCLSIVIITPYSFTLRGGKRRKKNQITPICFDTPPFHFFLAQTTFGQSPTTELNERNGKYICLV
jgi:hypothetical protein